MTTGRINQIANVISPAHEGGGRGGDRETGDDDARDRRRPLFPPPSLLPVLAGREGRDAPDYGTPRSAKCLVLSFSSTTKITHARTPPSSATSPLAGSRSGRRGSCFSRRPRSEADSEGPESRLGTLVRGPGVFPLLYPQASYGTSRPYRRARSPRGGGARSDRVVGKDRRADRRPTCGLLRPPLARPRRPS